MTAYVTPPSGTGVGFVSENKCCFTPLNVARSKYSLNLSNLPSLICIVMHIGTAAGTKHIDNGREHLPRGHWLATRSGLALVFPAPRTLAHRNQQLDLVPQCVRHRPRLDLRHFEPHLRPVPGFTDKIIGCRNQAKHYLRISSNTPKRHEMDAKEFFRWC